MLRRFMMKSGLIALACCASFIAHAMADSPKAIDVPAGALVPALEALQKQAAVELVYQAEQLKSFRTNGVKGTYTAHDAVQLLLKGTPLELRTDPSGAMLIAPPRAHTTSTEGLAQSPATSAPPTGDSLQLGQTAAGEGPGNASVEKPSARGDQATELREFQPNIPEILIKGSRIMNVDVKRTEDDVQPYTILTSEQIERSGATNVEDFLKQQLTMNTSVQSSDQRAASLSGTTSSINLRGLGANETLILIDGRRSAGVSLEGTSYQPDINGIPLSAIERIEVLPSSASAIYGGAAVGGVVNVVLKRSFNGGEISYTYDRASSSDASIRTVTASYGISLAEGQTQIMLSGHYSDGSPLLLKDRPDLVERGISTIVRNSPSYLYNDFAPFQGAATNIGSLGGNLVLKNGTPLNSPITSVPIGAAPGSDISSGLVANAGTYNLGLSPGTGTYGLSTNFGTVPLTKSIFGTIRQTLFDEAQLFSELSTISNAGRTLYDPFGAAYYVPATAATNPFAQDVLVTFPSNLSSLQRTDSVTQSITVGLIAPLILGWSSEIDYTWSRNSFEVFLDSSDDTEVGAALSAGTLNPFVDTLAHPLDLNAFLAPEAFSASTTLNDVGLRISGPVASLPAGHPTLTVGLEHRKEGTGNGDLSQMYPLEPANSYLIRYFGQSQSTDSAYAEALIPLIAPRNAIPAAHSLDLDVAGRTERYTVYLQTPYGYIAPVPPPAAEPPQGAHTTVEYTSTNPTIGLKYRPVPDFILRASYATAFLPPTARELLANPLPACGPSPCRLITDPQTNLRYRINYIAGGNQDLQPQTSRDWRPETLA